MDEGEPGRAGGAASAKALRWEQAGSFRRSQEAVKTSTEEMMGWGLVRQES